MRQRRASPGRLGRCGIPGYGDSRSAAAQDNTIVRSSETGTAVILQRPFTLAGKHRLGLALAVALLATARIASAQVYKCKDAQGTTTYADAPCAAQGKSLKLPQSPSGSFRDATVCTQLQDEMRRLDDEAKRDARRGNAKGSSSAKRRQALLAQYHGRCAVITRSEGRRR